MSLPTQSGGPPNGGWGWVIVAAVALINIFTHSITSVFGLLFGDQLQSMALGTTSAALLTNLNSLALNFSGLFIAPAIKSFSPRNVTIGGCLFTSIGLVCCSFATQLWHFIVGYSLLVGIGLGMIAPSTFMVINSYFTTKRGRAVGIGLAGTGMGQMIVPHVVRVLLERHGFRMTILIMGGLALNGILGAAFFRPLPKRKNIREVKLLLDGSKECKSFDFEAKVVHNDEAQKDESKVVKICNKIFHRLAQAMDLELLRDPVFWSIILGMGLVYTATVNFSMLFPYFLQNSVGLTRSDTALCMSVVAGADIASRLLLPFATDKLKVPYRVVFLLGTIGLLASRTALAESTEFTSLVVLSAFTGITKSATVLNNNLTISSHCNPEKLAGGLGLNMITKGVLVISVGQLLGWIRDYSDSYVICLHAQNLMLGLVAVVWSTEILCKTLRKRTPKHIAIEAQEGERTNMTA